MQPGTETGDYMAPLIPTRAASDEERFGASRRMINEFRHKLLNMRRHGVQVRAKYELETQTPDQLEKTRAFIFETLTNKVIFYNEYNKNYYYYPV